MADEMAVQYDLAWLEKRLQALEQMEADLQEMKVLAETARDHSLDQEQIKVLNERINFLQAKVNVLDDATRESIPPFV